MVTTIHQPSSRLFHKFDKLILLGKGSLLYFGKASEATVYFSSIGCSPLIAMNPAEYLLDLANGNLNDVSVPSELEDKVQMGNSDTETRNGKPSPAIVHEVNSVYRFEKSTNKKRHSKEENSLPFEMFFLNHQQTSHLEDRYVIPSSKLLLLAKKSPMFHSRSNQL